MQGSTPWTLPPSSSSHVAFLFPTLPNFPPLHLPPSLPPTPNLPPPRHLPPPQAFEVAEKELGIPALLIPMTWSP